MDGKVNRRIALGRSLLQGALSAKGFRQKTVEGDGTARSRPHKDVPGLLRPASEANSQLQSTYGNLDKVLDQALSRKSLLMREKLKSKLETATTHQHGLMEALARANFDIENNPATFGMIEDIEQCQKQVQTLERQKQNLVGLVTLYQGTVREERGRIESLTGELKQVTRDNLALAMKEGERGRKEKKTAEASRRVRSGKERKRPDGTCQLRASLADLRHEVHHYSSLQAAFFLHEMHYEHFFQDCLSSCKHEFQRLQQLPNRHYGLQGSLYFQLVHKDQQSPTLRRVKSISRESRRVEDVLYDALKGMVEGAREEAGHKGVEMGREEWAHLKPMERVGLLVMDANAMRMVHEKVFPTNVLCLKPPSRASPEVPPSREDAVINRMRTASSNRSRRFPSM